MPAPLSGPGVGLAINQHLYPTELYNAPYDIGTNRLSLAGGDTFVLPAGDWYVDIGDVSDLQFLDPTTGTWRTTTANRGGLTFVKSDGFNARLANLTGCPVAAIVVAGGQGYVQSTTSIVPSTGNSTWQAIVGGMLSVVSLSAAGGNYGIAPLVLIDAPPSPGVQATAYASIGSGGTVSGVTLSNVGAGYPSVPNAVIVPSPQDPNLNAGITNATVVLALNASSTLASAISAVLCTNPGAPTTTLPTLTISGSGTSGSINCVTLSALTGLTIGGAGAGYGTNVSELQTVGGQPVGVPAYTNPAIQMTSYRPRKASALLASGSTLGTLTSLSTIYDAGKFAGLPLGVIVSGGAVTTVATITLAVGTVIDSVVLQQAP